MGGDDDDGVDDDGGDHDDDDDEGIRDECCNLVSPQSKHREAFYFCASFKWLLSSVTERLLCCMESAEK